MSRRPTERTKGTIEFRRNPLLTVNTQLTHELHDRSRTEIHSPSNCELTWHDAIEQSEYPRLDDV